MWTVFVRTFSDNSTFPGGSEFTKSMKSLAGTVMAPSSSTFAGTQQLIPTSRLVAVRRKRPESVRRRTLPRIGKLPLVETPRPAIPNPRRGREHPYTRHVHKRGSLSTRRDALSTLACLHLAHSDFVARAALSRRTGAPGEPRRLGGNRRCRPSRARSSRSHVTPSSDRARPAPHRSGGAVPRSLRA